MRNAFRPQTLFELSDAFTAARDDPDGRRDRAHRRGPRRLLLGRRPAHPGRRRLHRRRRGGPPGHRAAQRARPADPDPAPAQAGGGHGGRLRHRRRARPPPGLRPDHRRRQRPLRPDRPDGGQLRRRLRLGPAGPHHRLKRAKEIWFLCRQYDAEEALEWGLVNTVVPLAELEAETVAWCRRMLDAVADRPADAQGRLQRRRRRPGRRPAARRRRHDALLHDRGGPGGPERLRRAAAARTSPGSPAVREPDRAGRAPGAGGDPAGRAPARSAVAARRPTAHAAGGGRPGRGRDRRRLVVLAARTLGRARTGRDLVAGAGRRWWSPWPSRSAPTTPTTTPTGSGGPTRSGSGPLRLVASGLASPAAVRTAALVSLRRGRRGRPGPGRRRRRGGWWPSGRRAVAAGWLYTGRTPPLRLPRPRRAVRVRLLRPGGHGRVDLRPGRPPRPWLAWRPRVPVGLLGHRAARRPTTCATSTGTHVAGKRTLAVRLGRRPGRLALRRRARRAAAVGVVLRGPAGARGPCWRCWPRRWPCARCATVAGAPEGRQLLPVLGATGRLQLAVGLLLALGIVL